MTATLPIKELKDTAAFTRSVQTSQGPITITRNGYGAFVAMSCEEYEAIQLDRARLRLYERMDQAEREHAEGRALSWDEQRKRISDTYGI